ncbi:MAG TPA: DUF6474 family protein [Actinophytocola sp.]|uniref:DUF6474 family protein n=1 Tax=Actinophytocola sp. TaxID=1872138 RepID=UPI002DDD8D6B|nr:DUF6474 family protein [Actinophytocola sp.]HEV2780613.1 DUF6474 family protein [Actinophytocola sp.]
MALRKRAAAGSSRITPARAKNAIAVAKIVGPAVLPVLTPYLTRTAGSVRDRWDRLRARRLGVGIDDLAKYTGRGGVLHARIAGAADSLAELKDSDAAFAATTRTRLRQLTAAVRAAERMPSARRKAAHRAVAVELDRIEGEILKRLGV